MDTDQDRPHDWIERAVAQACALRETVKDEQDLRDLVDVILIDLATRVRGIPECPEPKIEF